MIPVPNTELAECLEEGCPIRVIVANAPDRYDRIEMVVERVFSAEDRQPYDSYFPNPPFAVVQFLWSKPDPEVISRWTLSISHLTDKPFRASRPDIRRYLAVFYDDVTNLHMMMEPVDDGGKLLTPAFCHVTVQMVMNRLQLLLEE